MSEDKFDAMNIEFPPLSPEGEASAPADPTFVKECLSDLASIVKPGQVQIGPYLISNQKPWGLIFRVDYKTNDKLADNLVDRIIFWRLSNDQLGVVYAVGQDLPPLTSK